VSALRRTAAWLGFAACALLAAVMLLPGLLGYHRYVITGDSMTGSYDRGSVLIAREVPTSQLRRGDVITYQPPSSAHHRGLITHRIASVSRDASGRPSFRTRGDANPALDPWKFVLDRPTQARAVAHVPYVGYAVGVLGMAKVRMLVIGLPAALIAFLALAGLWREAGEEARRQPAARTGGASA
jgi:signal peptidase